MPPANQAPYQCPKGLVLRADSPGLTCADYSIADEAAGPCMTETCCTTAVCSAHRCASGWTLRPDHGEMSCYFGCTDAICCDPPPDSRLPKHHAAGLTFVDRDPARFVYGGKVTIHRAYDESDITHYRVYWGFMKVLRKVPSCTLARPVSWNTEKYLDTTKLLKEVRATGCDISFDIPMGTKAQDHARCEISFDRKDRTKAVTDECNPHYLMVVAVNRFGEKPVTRTNEEQVGPRLPISDYEGEWNLPCAESGVTGGHDLPGPADTILGVWNQVESAADCAALCRAHHDPITGPCRYWTWSVPTGGPTHKSCWIETQTTQRSHYGVRVMGPAVCPTRDGELPTGKERPRCTRWVRLQNTIPFVEAEIYGWDNKQGVNFVQPPRLPDNPLGPYDNAEQCQGVCDQDVLCIGIVWMKRNKNFRYRRCWLVRVDSGLRVASQNFDMWFCSRETLPPLINGYTHQKHHFGYKTCATTALSNTTESSYDCCANQCDAQSTCSHFTYHDGTNGHGFCELYSSCPMALHTKAEGCAYEGCFSGYGAATYSKDTASIEFVDPYPFQANPSGIEVNLQTNGLVSEEVVCVAVLAGPATTMRSSLPESAKAMKAQEALKNVVVTSSVVDSVASLVIRSETGAASLSYTAEYTIRCGLTNHAEHNLPAAIDFTYQTTAPPGYRHLGNGWCRVLRNACIKTQKDFKDKVYSLETCKTVCDGDSSCTAFAFVQANGMCITYGNCAFNIVDPKPSIFCLVKVPVGGAVLNQTDATFRGGGECSRGCGNDDMCLTKRTFGRHTRNVFLPARGGVCSDSRKGNVTEFAETAGMTLRPSVLIVLLAFVVFV